jgi:hypothetical protein
VRELNARNVPPNPQDRLPMTDTAARKCAFAAPITTGRAACSAAVEVVRRGGAEYDCDRADAHARCLDLIGGLKLAGLAAFGVEDDLTQTPHSVLVKIQTGGLVGLRRLLDAGSDSDAPVADVAVLAEQVVAAYGGAAEIPFGAAADAMLACRLERRGRRSAR